MENFLESMPTDKVCIFGQCRIYLPKWTQFQQINFFWNFKHKFRSYLHNIEILKAITKNTLPKMWLAGFEEATQIKWQTVGHLTQFRILTKQESRLLLYSMFWLLWISINDGNRDIIKAPCGYYRQKGLMIRKSCAHPPCAI